MAKLTTLCYIRQNDAYLMLLRNKKEQDYNEGKWIGTGGKIEKGETPDECMLREVKEETGLTLTSYRFRGIITFISDQWEDEYMILYEGLAYEGELVSDCAEGTLAWIPFDRIPDLPMWEGDRQFLPDLIGSRKQIFMKLVYRQDHLEEVVRDAQTQII